MAMFKPVVRTPRKDGFYQVYIRVMQNRKPGYIKTDKVVTNQLLDKDGNITDAFVNEYCTRRILRFTELLNRVDSGKWTVRQVIEYVTKEDEDLCFSDYARLHINRMIDNGQDEKREELQAGSPAHGEVCRYNEGDVRAAHLHFREPVGAVA